MSSVERAPLARQRLRDLLTPLENLWLLKGNLGLVEPACQLLVSGAPSDATFREAVETVLEVALPGPGELSGFQTYALWQAPDRWLVVGDEAADLAERLKLATAGINCLVSDVTDGLAVFEIEGHWARDLLAQGTGLDLREERFGPGQAAATLFAGLPATIYPVGIPHRFRMHVERASVRFVWNWLSTAVTPLL